MAFQQPTRQPIQRPVREASLAGGSSDNLASAAAPHAAQTRNDPSQTWVLFSPAADTATSSSSLLESLSQSQPTAGHSRLSAVGSLASIVQSSAVASEDDAELDSLDSHLADFRPAQPQNQTQSQSTNQNQNQPLQTSSSTVNLPMHDGLGSFRLGAAVQEHLYAFEQFNPRRIAKRRRSSLERELSHHDVGLGQFAAETEFIQDLERTRRIEAWRWEHSRVLVEEIQKETRRRRNSELSRRRGSNATNATNAATNAGNKEAAAVPSAPVAAAAVDDDTGDWHEQEDDGLHKYCRTEGDGDDGDDEGLWSRLTREFMQEVMGIDDRILSVLFGEALADEQVDGDEVDVDNDDLSSTPRMPTMADSMAGESADLASSSSSWQMRMIERIARELGMFVHSHMGAHPHPGAFSTFTRVQQMPLPYAGLPVIPEANQAGSALHDAKTESKFASDITPTGTTASLPRFKPTIYQAQQQQQQPQQQPGHDDDDDDDDELFPETATPKAEPASNAAFTQDEWEQDLDIKLVFRYLRTRFFPETLGHAPHHAHTHAHAHLHAHRHAMSMQEAAVKAARVRQHHPLVGGQRERPRAATAAAAAVPLVAPRAPSCASQSTRRSAAAAARRSSLSTLSMSMSSRHSSRHYWDIGGSGSMIASAGPMGSWGEV